MANATLTERLAEFWSAAAFEALPVDVVGAAKRFLLDTLAVGIAGAAAPESRAVLSAARELVEGASGSASIWGTPHSLPAAQAALCNGTAAHALELDDFGGCGHNGAVVVPAVVALAEKTGASGRAVLAAIVAGYDIATRVTDAAGGYRRHKERGWHSTGTCGSFGSAAGAAKILGLDAARYADALGIAGTFTGGTWAFLVDGAMTKRYHPGRAAEIGLGAAILARNGMGGPRHIMEAPWGGFLATYAGETAEPNALLADLGRDFRILRSGIKPYACCRGIHSSLDALFDLLQEGKVQPDRITGFVVHGVEQTRRQLGGKRIDTVLDAQFSLPYALAVATESGSATLDQFSPPRRGNGTVDRLIAETEVVADGVIRFGEEPLLEVRLADGTSQRRHVPFPKGAPENPISGPDLHRKVAALVEPVLGQTRLAELSNAIEMLEHIDDFADVSCLLRSPK